MTDAASVNNIEQIDINLLVPYAKNARKHNSKQIAQLMKGISEFGFLVPILIDDTNTILAGHARLLAAQKLHLKTVPCIRVSHLSEKQKKAFIIADNRLAELAKWDTPTLREELNELVILGFDVELTGYLTGEVDLILDEQMPASTEDHLPEIPDGPAVSQLGDTWLCGKHRVSCANSLLGPSYDALMIGMKAQQVFTDPPYNVPIDGHVCGLGKVKHREFAMATGEMSSPEFTQFLREFMEHMCAHSDDGAIHYICMDAQHLKELLDAAYAVYGGMKQLCVWNKDNAGMGAFYRSKHELVAVFKHGKGKHINNFGLGDNGRYRTNVWDYPGANSLKKGGGRKELEDHPTPKCVAMVADAIRDCSRRDGIILDPFLGGGTTVIAAERTGRICYGMEIDPLYVDLTVRRWQEFTGQTAVHAETGQSFADTAALRQPSIPTTEA